jgi:hypothetical protein
VYCLSERPSFTGVGTDACEYAWMIFYPFERITGQIQVLGISK